MFVCVCNAIRESQVVAARAAGCETPEAAMAFLGAKLECRTCVSHLMDTLAAGEKLAEARQAS
ncbi:MAG: (2Fe-2S)-binding protein [Acidobacteria bacterium]|nr:(2Fe-2S)-binding protein [Acidobacteriota bacterium]